MSYVVVIDPGNSGFPAIDHFFSDGAESIIAAEEKAITLRLAEKVMRVIKSLEVQTREGQSVEVHLTRYSDETPCQRDRTNVVQIHDANIFLSLQFNSFDSKMRGTQAWIDRKYHDGHPLKVQGPAEYAGIGPGRPSSGVRNSNHADDANFASAMAFAAFSAIRKHDPDARLLSAVYHREHHGENYLPPPGVKMKAMNLLHDRAFGEVENSCLSCVLQLDFIDHPVVDDLFSGTAGSDIEDELAIEIAWAVIRFLE